MPLSEATRELHLAVELVRAEFDALNKVNRRWRWVIVGLSVVSVVLAGGMVSMYLIVDQQGDDREAACQQANSGREHARDEALDGDLAVVEAFAVVLSAGDTPEQAARTNAARDAIMAEIAGGAPTAEEVATVDRDCDGDGELTIDDYLDRMPDGLPVTIP